MEDKRHHQHHAALVRMRELHDCDPRRDRAAMLTHAWRVHLRVHGMAPRLFETVESMSARHGPV